MLTGATSYPVPGKSEAEMQSNTPNLDKLVAYGLFTKGFPKDKAKAKGRASTC